MDPDVEQQIIVLRYYRELKEETKKTGGPVQDQGQDRGCSEE